MKPLPYPNVVGAVDICGRICVGVTHNPKSRSKKGISRVTLFNPTDSTTATMLAPLVAWDEDAQNNNAILAEALRALLCSKGEIWDRATVAVQVTGDYLYLYEAGYRESLFPRWKWKLPYRMNYTWALSWAILQETRIPDKLVALHDTRKAVSLESDPALFA